MTARYNLLSPRYIEDETDIFTFARHHGTGVLIKQALGQGLLLRHVSWRPTAPGGDAGPSTGATRTSFSDANVENAHRRQPRVHVPAPVNMALNGGGKRGSAGGCFGVGLGEDSAAEEVIRGQGGEFVLADLLIGRHQPAGVP